MRPALLLALVLLALPAAAEPPRVDVRDLPPLPEEVLGEQVTGAALAAAAQAEEDVVTGAAKREQSLGSVASAVTVIPGDRLRRFGYRSLDEALRGVAGLFVAHDRMYARLGMRGVIIAGDYNFRILVLVDGATVNEPWNQYTGVSWDLPISLDDVARVEVVRGPVSSVYGTNAFFGIINIVTRSADQSPRAYGRVGVGGGSDEPSFIGSAGFAVGTIDRQVRGAVGFAGLAGSPYSVDIGGAATDIAADPLTAWNAALVARYDGTFAQVRGFRRLHENPIGPYEGVLNDPENQQSDMLLLTEVGHTRQVTKRLALTGRVYFNRYRYQDKIPALPPAAAFRDQGDSLWFGGELRGRAELGARGLLGLTAGLEVSKNYTASQAWTEGDEANAVELPTDFNVLGVYSEVDSTPLSWLTLTGGLRLDRNSKFPDNVSLSPRLGVLLYKGEQLGLKLLYARGFRNPSQYEAFFADGVDFEANPDLAPEYNNSYEAVLWGRPYPGLSARLSAFRWDLTGLLTQTLNTSTGLFHYTNSGAIASTGVEGEVSFRNTAGWLAFASATYARVEETFGGATERLVASPAIVTTAGGSSPPLLGLVHISAEGQLVGPRLTRDGVETKTHLGLNLAAYVPDVRGFDITVGLRNLTGSVEEIPAPEDYDRSAGAIYIVPGPGREIYARVGYRY